MAIENTEFRPSARTGAWTEAILYDFSSKDGGATYLSTSLIFGRGAKLHGTTPYGGNLHPDHRMRYRLLRRAVRLRSGRAHDEKRLSLGA
jgi:hypothetical protein